MLDKRLIVPVDMLKAMEMGEVLTDYVEAVFEHIIKDDVAKKRIVAIGGEIEHYSDMAGYDMEYLSAVHLYWKVVENHWPEYKVVGYAVKDS